MKLLIGLIITSLLAFHVSAQEHAESKGQKHKAEPENFLLQERSYSIGIGLPRSTELKALGINARGYYNIGEQFCFGPELFYIDGGKTEVFDVDLIAHYIFNTPLVGIFPVVGGNYTLEWETEHDEMHRENAFGVTYGLGVHRHFGNFTVFGEYTRVANKFGDSFVTVGLLYTIHPEH